MDEGGGAGADRHRGGAPEPAVEDARAGVGEAARGVAPERGVRDFDPPNGRDDPFRSAAAVGEGVRRDLREGDPVAGGRRQDEDGGEVGAAGEGARADAAHAGLEDDAAQVAAVLEGAVGDFLGEGRDVERIDADQEIRRIGGLREKRNPRCAGKGGRRAGIRTVVAGAEEAGRAVDGFPDGKKAALRCDPAPDPAFLDAGDARERPALDGEEAGDVEAGPAGAVGSDFDPALGAAGADGDAQRGGVGEGAPRGGGRAGPAVGGGPVARRREQVPDAAAAAVGPGRKGAEVE